MTRKDRSPTGCTADYVLPALPSPMELAEQQRDKEGEIWCSVYVTIEIYENELHFKAGNSNIHHTAIYTLTSTTRGREPGLDGQILILFHSHGCEGLTPGSSAVKLFTLKSLLRHKPRDSLFFPGNSNSKKSKLKQDGDDSESTTFVLTESSMIIHLGQTSFNISKKQYQNGKYLKKETAAFIPNHFPVKWIIALILLNKANGCCDMIVHISASKHSNF